MNNVFILISKFLDYNGKSFCIGGVETYIYNLCKLLIKNKYNVKIYQFSNHGFKQKFEDIEIIGVKVNCDKFYKARNLLYRTFTISESPDYEKDMLLFATDYMNCKNKFKNSISIQHGISWDINSYKKESKMLNILNIIKSALGAIKKYIRYSRVKKMVCVDYNFINWYRTQIKNVDNDLIPVLNFVEKINRKREFKDDKVKIIFARRLVEYRGTKLFADVMINVLKKHENVYVTIAGEGPDKNYMECVLSEFKDRVTFTKYSVNNSFKIHKNHDIAVVPTLGSEGTSLSLLEAMGAGCAVIATNVGGITNILLNGYNGIIVPPSAILLENAIEDLLNNKSKIKKLSDNALDTTKQVFNKKVWDEKWLNIINSIRGSNDKN